MSIEMLATLNFLCQLRLSTYKDKIQTSYHTSKHIQSTQHFSEFKRSLKLMGKYLVSLFLQNSEWFNVIYKKTQPFWKANCHVNTTKFYTVFSSFCRRCHLYSFFFCFCFCFCLFKESYFFHRNNIPLTSDFNYIMCICSFQITRKLNFAQMSDMTMLHSHDEKEYKKQTNKISKN